LNEQFTRQQATDHPRHDTCNDIERLLRNSRESFDCVRSVSPTRYRFRVVDGRGRDIRDSHALRSTEPEQSIHVDKPDNDKAWPVGQPALGEESGAYRVTSRRPSGLKSTAPGSEARNFSDRATTAPFLLPNANTVINFTL
jgi:hypothetical protein